MKFLQKYVAMWVIFFALAGLCLWAADNNDIPPETAKRILKIQLDESRLQNQVIQLQAQYQADDAALKHDAEELNQIKAEALAAAKKDPAGWDIDVEKLEFVAKSAPSKDAKK